MRRLAIAAAALLFAASQGFAGSFVTRTEQLGTGTIQTQYYDMSGTGIGPFLRVFVCSDGAGNVCPAGGGGGGGGGAVTGPVADGATPSGANAYPVLNGYRDASGATRTASPTQQLPMLPYDVPFSGTLDLTQTTGPTSYKDVSVSGRGFLVVNIAGLTGSGATITYTSTLISGATPATPINSYNASNATVAGTRTADGDVRIPVAGRATVRLAVTTPGTGSATLGGAVSGISVSGIVDLASGIPAGTNVLGKVGIDQTAPGTTNGVQINGTLPAFAATPTFNIGTAPPLAIFGPDAEGATPTRSPIYNAGKDGNGQVRAFGLDTRGSLIAPNVAAAGTTITKCSIPATSGTATCNTYVGTGTATAGSAVCPAATNLQSQEFRFSVPTFTLTQTASLGLSLVGNTLTSATDGTGTGTPDMVLPAQYTLYVLPVPQSNQVNAWNPNSAAAVTVCIQKARQ